MPPAIAGNSWPGCPRFGATDVNLATTYAYDAAGNKAHEALPNSVTSDYTYDTLNHLVDVNTADATGKSLLSQTFILNKDGTRASLHQEQLQNDNTTVVTTDTNWAYDPDGRLSIEGFTSTAAGESYGNLFAYDLAGNRLYQQHTGPGGGGDQTTSYTYDARNELTNQGGTSFTYDLNGSELSSSDGRSFTYDVRNKMVSATLNGQTSTYVYDDNGNRVAETTGGVTTYYLTDHANPTGYAQPIEAKSSPMSMPSETYLTGDHVFAQVNNTGTVSYLQTDGHGSTEQLTDTNGAVTQAFRYDAFGGAINFTLDASIPTAFLFGGDAIYDPASGLYQHGDFTRGRDGFRFVQRDSGGYGTNSDPLSLHKYLYAGADPIGNLDFNGHDFSELSLLATATIQSAISAMYVGIGAGVFAAARGVALGLSVNQVEAGFLLDTILAPVDAFVQKVGAIATLLDQAWDAMKDGWVYVFGSSGNVSVQRANASAGLGLGAIVFGVYGKLRYPKAIYQANHLNQYAAFKDDYKAAGYSRDDGLAIMLQGSTQEPGSEHYRFHQYLRENLWNPARRAGRSVTVAEYNRAVFHALSQIRGPETARFAVSLMVREQVSLRLGPTSFLKKIPRS